MRVLLKILKYVFVGLVASTVIGSAVGIVVMLVFSQGLPNIITVEDYKPAKVTRVLAKDGTVVGEFFEERRYVVPMEKIPEKVARAFISAEDDRFFEHQGIDIQGILRAAFANFRAGHVVQGGSTITQQVAKSLLLTPERSFMRKIREVILSTRMERNLSKQQILYLYLNQIYLGNGAYGVEAAAHAYYNKEAKDLTIAEAAVLAGLPQAPSKYSPLLNPKRAKERQLYVLRRMHEDGVITQAQAEQAAKEPIKLWLPQDINAKYAPYYVEYIRKHLIEQYGKESLYQGGMTVQTPIDARLSLVATKAIQEGLRNVDKKQGWRGPIRKATKSEEFEEAVNDAVEYNISKKFPYQVMLPSGEHADALKDRLDPGVNESDLFDENEIYKGVVTAVDDSHKEAQVRIGPTMKGFIPLDKMRWAQPVKVPSSTGIEPIGHISQSLEKGDLIWVRIASKKSTPITLSLEQVPLVQSALLSMDARTGEVLAMVGGYSYAESEFNRTTQALRQPGSAYKPIIYSSALDKGYTPVTIIQDSPIVFDAGESGKWKPENFEEKFYGDTPFRSALIRSRNIPTIKIVQDVSIPYLIDYSKRLGITEHLVSDLSISLGSMSISLLDLAKVYAIFPRGGRKVKPIFIQKIVNAEGKVLEENASTPSAPPLNLDLPHPPPTIKVCGELQAEQNMGTDLKRGEFQPDPADPDRVLDPRTAYVMTHLMNEVATMGTGAEAKNLGRAAAGKTGTTNDYIDAWFMGFTPHLVTGVWTGFDTQKTIAPKATGAMVSLPIWLDFMKEAVKNYPDEDFAVPKGVVFATVDSKTGRKVAPKSPNSVLEAFVEGTEPGSASASGTSPAKFSPNAPQDGETDPADSEFLKQDIE